MGTDAYRHLLVAVDFEPESEPVVARAQQMRHLLNARLTLLHVVEFIPPAMESMYLGYSAELALPENQSLEQEMMEVARAQMDTLGDQLDVDKADRLLRIGGTGHVIDEVAAELGVDLVVMGTRGRHGLLALFGDTTRDVLRHAGCDVLCVKIPDSAH